ncbi:MAG: hypothetical protein Q4F98_08930 [Lachnospiraceae bacterium]|nr:hypothetical protein [Lachnospiraceae bacterium]
MNELGKTIYAIRGTIIQNSERKMAAEKALAAIKEELPAEAFTCETIEDVLQLAKDIAYASPLH